MQLLGSFKLIEFPLNLIDLFLQFVLQTVEFVGLLEDLTFLFTGFLLLDALLLLFEELFSTDYLDVLVNGEERLAPPINGRD